MQKASGSRARSVPASATCASSAGSSPHAAMSPSETHAGACITYMPQACRHCSAASLARRATPTAAPFPCASPWASAASLCASTDPTRSTTVRASASGTRSGPSPPPPVGDCADDCGRVLVPDQSCGRWHASIYILASSHPCLRPAAHAAVHPARAAPAVVLLGQALEDAEEEEQRLELLAQVWIIFFWERGGFGGEHFQSVDG